MAIIRYTSIAESTNCTWTFLPALVMRSAFHPGNWSAILSIKGWIYPLVSFLRERGKPKYLQGNSDTAQGNIFWIVFNSISPHLMGKTLLFWRFVLSPEASPKRLRISITRLMSSASGLINNTTSSTYREILCCRARLVRGCRNPSLAALETKCPSTSITKINSIGDRGSPWRKPRWWTIAFPRIPFNRTCVEEDASSPLISLWLGVLGLSTRGDATLGFWRCIS